MLFVKYLLTTIGFGFLLYAAGILLNDLYLILRSRRPRSGSLSIAGEGQTPAGATEPTQPNVLHWRDAARLSAIGLLPLLLGISVSIVPSGQAGVRLNQFRGARPDTLYPGVHWITPLVERVQLFNVRDHVFSTSMADDPKSKIEALRVQTKEGLNVGLAVTVRYKLDPSKLPYIYSNLPQPVEEEIVPPTVASVFRQAAPNYTVREVFASRGMRL